MTAESKRLCPDCGLELPPTGPCPHCLLRLALDEEPADRPSAEPPVRPPTGLQSRFFGDYELLDEVARGGMGVVYRARQLSLKRMVALKMVHASHLNSPEARSRFALEVATSAQLSHPNIVALYESGEFRGTHFFTMRLVEGGDLARHIKARRSGEPVPMCAAPPLHSPAAIASLVIKSARALHYAHELGILHRDVKPSNILIDLQGEPHLADFGLAKMLSRDSANTFADSVLGSPNYMAPEQAAGLNEELTTAMDVYGLGTVLYEALTGVPPFQAATPLETIRKVIDEEPIPPRRLKTGIDPDLETICLKCLEKRPGARYGSAELLAADLERWRDGHPIRARPMGVGGTILRWSRRHPGIAGLSAALFVALAAIGFGLGIAMVRIRAAERQAVANLREALIGQAHALSLAADRGTRAETLKVVERALALGGPPEFRRRARDQMLAALALTDLTFSPQLALAPGDGVDRSLLALDPAMERWAMIRNGTTLEIKRVVDGLVERRLPIDGSRVVQVSGFSPDGRYLATRHARGFSIWDTQEGRRVFATNGVGRAFSFSAVRAEVVVEEDDGSLSIRELPSFQERLSILPAAATISPPVDWHLLSWSPDGQWIAGARSQDGSLDLIEAATGRSRWEGGIRLGNVTSIAWAPEQEAVVVGTSAGSVRLVRWSGGSGVELHNAASSIEQVAIGAGSSVLAARTERGVLSLIELSSRRRIYYGLFDGPNLAFDPAGVRVGPVGRGHELGWLDLSGSSEFRQIGIASSSVGIERCVFSPDGRLLAGAHPGLVQLRRSTDGGALARLTVGPLSVFAFDPLDGAVFTSDAARGIRRWGIRSVAGGQRELLAPEVVLRSHGTARSLAFSADGERLAAGLLGPGLTLVFDSTRTNLIGRFGPHDDLWGVALSPDGGRLATVGGRPGALRVWDVASQRMETSLPAGPGARVEFSGDGRWLMAHGNGGLNLWRTSDWKPAPPLPFAPEHLVRSASAFSRDGRILAVTVEGFEIQLFDLVMWEPLGLLRPPLARFCNSLAFSPDGTQLAVGCSRGQLRIWALDEIRAQLRSVDLDWDLPPLPIRAPEPKVELRRVTR